MIRSTYASEWEEAKSLDYAKHPTYDDGMLTSATLRWHFSSSVSKEPFRRYLSSCFQNDLSLQSTHPWLLLPLLLSLNSTPGLKVSWTFYRILLWWITLCIDGVGVSGRDRTRRRIIPSGHIDHFDSSNVSIFSPFGVSQPWFHCARSCRVEWLEHYCVDVLLCQLCVCKKREEFRPTIRIIDGPQHHSGKATFIRSDLKLLQFKIV